MAKRQPKRKPGKPITTKRVQAMEDKPVVLPQTQVTPDVDEDAWGNDGLTIRQRAFVEALVGPAGGNATKAAEMAGYASDNRRALAVTACQALGKPNVQEAIAHALAIRNMTPEWAQRRLVEIASSSMRNFINVASDGKLSVDWLKAAEAGAIGQIREIREDVLPLADGREEVIKRSFKLHDVVGALQTVLKLSGLLKDEATIKLTGEDGGPVEIAHKFDHDRFSELYRSRARGNRPRPDAAASNGN